jgi:hypothetical protein
MTQSERGRWTKSKITGEVDWVGSRIWAEVRGPARLKFLFGTLERVKDCLLPDGTRRRVDCQWDFFNQPTASYVSADRMTVFNGNIRVGLDDVQFFPAHRLDEDLAASPRIRELVRNRTFALRLYFSLCNVDWFCRGSYWHSSWSNARQIVSRLSGLEPVELLHHSLYLPADSFTVGEVADDVAFELGKLGWKSADNWPDLEQDIMVSARIKALVQERDFAQNLYRSLCYIVWLNEDRPWFSSPYHAGDIVPKLRGRGETRIDVLEGGGEGMVSPDVEQELAALGWTVGWITMSASAACRPS